MAVDDKGAAVIRLVLRPRAGKDYSVWRGARRAGPVEDFTPMARFLEPSLCRCSGLHGRCSFRHPRRHVQLNGGHSTRRAQKYPMRLSQCLGEELVKQIVKPWRLSHSVASARLKDGKMFDFFLGGGAGV